MQKHLCSPLEQTRTLGMIVGENLMNDLAWAERSEDLKRLKFEVKLEICLKIFPLIKRINIFRSLTCLKSKALNLKYSKINRLYFFNFKV